MSRIFLSHSSKDNDRAVALRDWLAAQGWDDVFLDRDPLRGIVAGDQWERALNQAALRCEVVLFLVSRAWLDSDWCLKEFNLAYRLNKRLFGILIEDIPVGDLPATLTGTWQLVPLASGRDHVTLRALLPGTHDEVHVTFSQEGLTRLRIGLERAGLDARFFAWPPENDPQRPPYRGLLPLEAADAGIFFGRDAPTIEVLDRIRGFKDGAAPRLLVLLGASGAGKSSFLRAGLLPRLARDDRNYLTLPVIRPERAAINGANGLLRSLETAFVARGLTKPRAEIREAIEGGATTLRPSLQTLIAQAQKTLIADDPNAKAPILILAIDQGEELFQTDDASEGAVLLTLLRDLLVNDDPALVVIITIRSDAYEQFQTAKPLEGTTQQTLSLTPMPRGAYQAVIEGPAARLKETDRPLVIEPGLTQALLSDIEEGGGRDALPLLAFTLERLYLEYGGRGRLTLNDYDALGRIKGSIEAAVERAFRAADNDARIPRDRDARLVLLRRGLIPWLAGIDPDTGSPRRQKARLSEIPEEARPLIDLLVEQRLLSTDVSQDTGERTIEPAHEALLRQWGSLQGWLIEDFAALTTLDGVKRSARDWAANARYKDWLNHSGNRLEDAEKHAARKDLSADLTTEAWDYLAACRARDRAEQQAQIERAERERDEQERRVRDAEVVALANQRTARNTGIGLVVALVLTALAVWQWRQGRIQTQHAIDAKDVAQLNESRFLTQMSIENADRGEFDLATLLAREALPQEVDRPDRPWWSPAVVALSRSLRKDRRLSRLAVHAVTADFSTNGWLLVTASEDKTARVWDTRTGALTAKFDHSDIVRSAKFSPSGKEIVTASGTTAHVWNIESETELIALEGHPGKVLSAEFSPDGTQILTLADDNTARLWDAHTGTSLAELKSLASAAFSRDGRRVVVVSPQRTAQIFDARTGKKLRELIGKPVTSVKFSRDGQLVLTAAGDQCVVWDVNSGKPISILEEPQIEGIKCELSPDSKTVVTGTSSAARLWNANTGERILELSNDRRIWSVAFSPDGSQILTSSSDNRSPDAEVRLWDVERGTLIDQLKAPSLFVGTPAFSPDGRRIAASFGGWAWILDGRPNDQREGILLTGHTKLIEDVVVSEDGESIATVADDHTVRVWDSRTGRTKAVFDVSTGNVWRLTISPDGTRVATASTEGTAQLWDTRTAAFIAPLDGHTDRVSSIKFSPDGQRILTASWDNTARIWDAKTGAALGILKGHTDALNSAVFSPSGGRIVTASADQTARVWDTVGNLLSVLVGHSKAVTYAEFSSDEKQIVSSAADFSAILWDEHYKRRFTLTNPGFTGFDLRAYASFSPDGLRVVTTGIGGNALQVWDTRNGAIAAMLSTPPNQDIMRRPQFGPDGHVVIATDARGIARMWDAQGGIQLDELRWYGVYIQTAAFSPNGKFIIARSGQTASIVPIMSKEDMADFGSVVAFRTLSTRERNQNFLSGDGKSGREAELTDGLGVNDCDRLAANASDPRKQAPGVSLDAITDQAVEACRTALLAKPAEPRFMYQLGRALDKQEDGQAIEMYRRAAELGYAAAHINLAVAYQNGRADVPRNIQLAVEHYQAAWDLGVPAISVNLAQLYLDGKLLPADKSRGMEWLKKGIAANVPGAHLEFADRSAKANETVNLEDALYHYRVAKRLYEERGDQALAQAARYRSASLARNMDPAAVVRAARNASISR